MKRHAPAATRNRDAIADVLRDELPAAGTILEVASGSGEHALHFARIFSHLEWQPSDPDPDARASISAWRAEAGLANLAEPLALDAGSAGWPIARANAVFCVNMIHISPVEATQGLLAGAARLLAFGEPLVLYGPFIEADVPTAPSNVRFDADLRARDPRWGLRDLAWLDLEAATAGLQRTRRVTMPANNLTLVYRRH